MLTKSNQFAKTVTGLYVGLLVLSILTGVMLAIFGVIGAAFNVPKKELGSPIVLSMAVMIAAVLMLALNRHFKQKYRSDVIEHPLPDDAESDLVP